MDFCKIKDSYFFNRNVFLNSEDNRKVKELFLSTIFRVLKTENGRVTVSPPKKFFNKKKAILRVATIDSGNYCFPVKHIQFLTFVDLWEEKRRA